jgi:hypothetical protein
MPRLALMFGLWGMGLGLLYWTQVRHFDPNPGWKSLWSDGFLSQGVTLFGWFDWTVGRLFHLAGVPTGFRDPGAACLLLLAGVVGWSRENRFHLACLLVPILVCVFAAIIGVYPFSGRVILFLGPLAILAVARGVQELVGVATREAASRNLKQDHRTGGWHAKLGAIGWQIGSGSSTWLLGATLLITFILGIGKLHRHSWLYVAVLGFIVCVVFAVLQWHVSARRRAMRLVVGAIVCLVMRYPAQAMFDHTAKGLMYRNPLFWDYKFEETKPLLAYIQEHWEPGDRVYLYSQSYVAFEFYADRFGIPNDACVRGILAGLAAPSWQDLRRDVEKMERHPRVWFVFTHVWMNNGVSEREVCTRILEEEGSLQAELVMPEGYDASVHLYEFPQAVAAAAKGNTSR